MKRVIKFLLLSVSFCLGGAVFAENIDWQSWQPVKKSIVPGSRDMEQLKLLPAGKNIIIPAQGVDLFQALDIPYAENQQLWLIKKVTVLQDTKVKLGMGVDWWFEVFCNGRIAYSTYRSGGNNANVITAEDHIVELDLKKGENFIAIYLKSGRSSFKTAIKVLSRDLPAGRVSRMLVNKILNPCKFQLRQGPWLLAPDPGSMTVAFLTDGNVAGGVAYRLKGTKEWKHVWHTVGGILNNATDLHRIMLTGLEPGKVYEYRVLIALNNKDYKALDIHSFTVPPASAAEFEFFVTGDTQFSAAQRGRYLAGWHDLMKNAALQISLGDLAGTYDDLDLMVFGGFFDWLAPEIRYNKPFIAVHGNHELRGAQNARWIGLFGSSEGKRYYSFSYGKVCFVVLDCWGDTRDVLDNSLSSDAREKYLQEQRQWVQKLLDSPEYTSADYRIIMAHSAPHACGTASGIGAMSRLLAEPLVKASRENGKQIHLFLAGHIHCYRRTLPGVPAAYANAPVAHKVLKDAKLFNFPIVIVDGPGKNIGFELSAVTVKVAADYLEVKSFDEKSRCFDHFTINKKAEIKEIDNPYKKAILKKYQY